MTRSRRPMSPYRFHALAGLGIALAATAALLLLVRPTFTWYAVLAAWLVAVNLTAFGYYGFDKARARAGGRRVPERILHLLALAGGSLGAWVAMGLFRHKTVDGRFRAVFWCVVAVQVGLAVWVGWLLWRRGA
jgi:uncharacterized membrane protein YsdA (DUF1294 family)